MIKRFRFCFLLTLATLLWSTLSYAENGAEHDFQQAQATAQQAFDLALHVKQSASQFAHKKNISDKDSELAIFVSLSSTADQAPLELEIEIKLNGNTLSSTHYGNKAINTLLQGSAHQVYIGNIPQGSHDLIAFVKERNNKQRITSNGAIRFSKDNSGKVYELFISVSDNDIPPEVIFIDHS